VTIRIRYRILNARLAAGAVSGGGVDQAYDGWPFQAFQGFYPHCYPRDVSRCSL
jgi:hypothetical protein